MSVVTDAIEAGSATPSAAVEVWDPFVRLFHWALVSLFAVAFVTGGEVRWLHVPVGYGIVALTAARVLWGLVGPRHARFNDFVRSPREALAYLRDVVLLRAGRHIGHNPAGGMMIVAQLTTLSGIATTGLMMTAGAFRGAEWIEEGHEALVNLMLALIALHLLGVVVGSLTHRENLVRAMITGRKRA